MKKYDIIGDIHAYGEELKSLLGELGYKKNTAGVYVPPESGRKAVFTGDYIDRGAENFEVIEIVRKMVEAGYAHAVMGNHDLNASMYHTSSPDAEGQVRPMRPHNEKNSGQHTTFLHELRQFPQIGARNIAWLKSLPVWLELDGMRFVHAQWHQESMDLLRQSGVLNDDNTVKPEKWPQLAYETPECKAVEMLTKGTEIELGGLSFKDADGHTRYKARLKWWANPDEPSLTLDQVVLDTPAGAIPKMPVSETIRQQMRVLQQSGGKTIFFGHYWMKGAHPAIETKNAICIDQSVAKDGHLAAATVAVDNGKIQDIAFTSVKSRPPHKASLHL